MSGMKAHLSMPLQSFGLTYLMLWKQSMDNKERR